MRKNSIRKYQKKVLFLVSFMFLVILSAFHYSMVVIGMSDTNSYSIVGKVLAQTNGDSGSNETVTINPVADSYVHEGNVYRNYGSNILIKVDGNTGESQIVYLKFDLTSFSGKIVSAAKLRLMVTNGSNTGQTVRGVVDTSWQESEITYNNKPTLGDTIAIVSNAPQENWLEIDVTQIVSQQVGDLFSLAIESNGVDGMDSYSKENPIDIPELVVEYTAPDRPIYWEFHESVEDGHMFKSLAPGYEGDYSAYLQTYTKASNVQIYQKDISLDPHECYEFSFAGKSNTGHDVRLLLHSHTGDYVNYGLNFVADLSNDWQTFSTTFETINFDQSVTNGRLRFWFPEFEEAGDEYRFDSVSLLKVDPVKCGNGGTPTATPAPTSTPISTATPAPTSTPISTATPIIVNLAPNPSFETNPDVDHKTAGSSAFTWALDKKRSGLRSIKIISNQPIADYSGCMTKLSAIPATAGKSYNLSGYFTTNNTESDSVSVNISFWDFNWNKIGGNNEEKFSGTTTWEKHGIQATSPAGTMWMRIEYRLYGSGELWIDDVWLQ